MPLDPPIDPLGVDRIVAGGSPLALEERGDPPESIARPGIHQPPDIGREPCISGAGLRTTPRALAGRSPNQVETDYPKGLGDSLHGVSSGACGRDTKVGFLTMRDRGSL